MRHKSASGSVIKHLFNLFYIFPHICTMPHSSTNMTGSNSPSSSSIPPGIRPPRKGPTKYPKIKFDRLDTEKAAVITSLSRESDVTVAPSLSATITSVANVTEISEKATQEQSEQEKPKKKTDCMSIILQKDGLDIPLASATPVSTDLRTQSSKGHVLSNLLKFKGIGRQEKVRSLSVNGLQAADKIVMSGPCMHAKLYHKKNPSSK